MDDADQVRRIGVGEGEAEFSGSVSLRVADFFHACGEFNEDDFVAGGGLIAGAIGDSSGKSSGE
jgi:hypothetical protein